MFIKQDSQLKPLTLSHLPNLVSGELSSCSRDVMWVPGEDTDSLSVVSIPSPSSRATVCMSRRGSSVFLLSRGFFKGWWEEAGPIKYFKRGSEIVEDQ